MAEEDDDPAGNKGQEDTGPKIKMGRIGKGKKGKKRPDAASGGGAGESYTKQLRTTPGDMESRPAGPLNENDVEFMKKAIQILCQSTNPLGKSIDFVTDDVDSMSKEYEHWRKEAIQCNQALEDQQKITEEVVQPL